jgi:hypothetical protein
VPFFCFDASPRRQIGNRWLVHEVEIPSEIRWTTYIHLPTIPNIGFLYGPPLGTGRWLISFFRLVACSMFLFVLALVSVYKLDGDVAAAAR